MLGDGDSQRGFFRGFAQHPVTYAVACVLLVAGISWIVWGTRAAPGLTGLGGHQVGGVLLVGAAIFCLYRVGLWPDKPRSEIERWQRRRRGWLVNAIVFCAYAVLMPVVTWKVWISGLRKGDPTWLALPGSLVVGSLIVVAFMLWRYQRAGRRLRRLQGRCEKCGYDLRSLPEPRCPECGTPFGATNPPL